MRYLAYDMSKVLLRVSFGLAYGLKVTGQSHVPRTGPFVLASNHLSFLDPPLLGAACPRRLRFMARSDLFRHPVLGWYLRQVNVMPLQRGEADIGAVRLALDYLRRGDAVALFPEGTRQLSGTLGTAKRGVGLLATLAKVPIVPVFVRGTFDALPPHAKGLQPAKIRVAFGEPISYNKSLVLPTVQSDTPRTAGRAALPGGPAAEEGIGSASRAHHEVLAAAVTEAWRRLQQSLG